MNQHSPNTKSAQIREALRKLGRATTRQLSWETDLDVRFVQDSVRMQAKFGLMRLVGVSRHHEAGAGKFGYIYEMARPGANPN